MRKYLPFLIMGIMLLSSCLFAQNELSDEAATAVGLAAMGIMAVVYVIIGLASYLFFAIVFMKIAQKLDVDNAWFAFLPIFNLVLTVQCARKPVWWVLLLFIPFVNIIISIMVMMAISENLGKPSWWGIVISLVPIVNIIMLGILAFGKTDIPAASTI